MSDTLKLEDFISQNRISMTAEWTDHNPNMDSRDMDHWKVTLRMGKARMTTYFSMGYGHNGKQPEAADVLSCLADDSAGVENAGDFEGFCSEFGYDTDSRKAEKTYKACQHSAARLKKFLGDDLYQSLLWNTERR